MRLHKSNIGAICDQPYPTPYYTESDYYLWIKIKVPPDEESSLFTFWCLKTTCITIAEIIETFWSKLPPDVFLSFYVHFCQLIFSLFLIACTRLDTQLCPSVRPSVCLSVRPLSVRPSVCPSFRCWSVTLTFSYFFYHFYSFKSS